MMTRQRMATECPAIRRIRSAIAQHSSFLLVTHFDPDGDGIGSALALWHLLRSRGKTSRVWLPKGVPTKYAFLPGANEVVTEGEPAPVAIAVDCDGPRRLGATADTVNECPLVIDIDHHAEHTAFGHISWADPAAAAVGYQVYLLVRALGAAFSPEMATCLYCAVGTDSGYFRYANTTPDLLRMAAEMIACGADPRAIAEKTLDRHDPAVARLAGRALASLTMRLAGRAAVAIIDNEDYGAAGTKETEGVIDYLRSVAGAELLVLMRESPEGWRVSMRSLADLDVGKVARSLGGGGHAPAAGCTLTGDAETAWAALEAALVAARQSEGGAG
jgi:phosphoesterase RecJ-like protein